MKFPGILKKPLMAGAVSVAILLAAGAVFGENISQVQEKLGEEQNVSAAAGEFGVGDSSEHGSVTVSCLNVRTGPWGKILGTLKKGAGVEIIGKTGDWYKIRHNGGTAYVHSAYISKSAAVQIGGGGSNDDGYVNVGASTLNVRTGPWGGIIGKLGNGQKVDITGKNGAWYKINYNGKTAYVHSDYISKSKPSGGSANVSKGGGGGFGGRPVAGGPVTSNYGPRKMFGNSFHYGIDIGVPTGTTLRALGSGRVVSTGWDYGGGRTIVIKYDNGYSSTYCHCQNATVSPGMRVSKGQTVGHTNNTGAWTTGPHLHFAMKNSSGSSVNPRSVPGITI